MTASKAELWDQLLELIKIIDQLEQFCNANTPNFLGMVDVVQQDYEGSHIGTTESYLKSWRSTLNGLVGDQNLCTPLIIELAKQGYNSTATGVAQALVDIAKGMDAGSETVRYRNWTYASVSAGVSNVGDGTVYRCTTDEYGNSIEVGAAKGGTVKIEIISDKNLGATAGNESASIYGSGVLPTDYIELGSAPGSQATISAQQSGSEGNLLSNPSFDEYSGTGATLEFTDWTLSSPSDATADNTDVFRVETNDATDSYAVNFSADNSLLCYLPAISAAIDTTRPVFLIVRYQRVSSADGTLTIRLGTQTETVDVSTKTNDVWNDLVLGIADEKGWYEVFKEDYNDSGTKRGVRVSIALSSNTTGNVRIDCCLLIQPTLYDGKYYLLTAGETDYLRGDYFTFADTVANTGRTQYQLTQRYGVSLPHATSGETYADA